MKRLEINIKDDIVFTINNKEITLLVSGFYNNTVDGKNYNCLNIL